MITTGRSDIVFDVEQSHYPWEVMCAGREGWRDKRRAEEKSNSRKKNKSDCGSIV